MGLFTDSVPRDLYDALQTRYDDLLNKYHALRPSHAPVAPMRVTAAPEEPGARALHAAEAAINDPRLAAMADNLMQQSPGLSPVRAMIEAKRLDDMVRGRTVAPSLPTGSEPPSR